MKNVEQEKEHLEKEIEKAKHDQRREWQLQGKLKEVNKHLWTLKRQQNEAQRMLRIKQWQEKQIEKMTEEIWRLKGQKDTI